MIDLGAGLDGGVLDLDEVADVDVFGDGGAGTQARERPDAGPRRDFRPLDMAKGEDFDAVADADAGAEMDIGADGDVPAEPGVETKGDAIGVEQRRPAVHGRLAQPGLHGGLGAGQVGPGIDAQKLRLVAYHHGAVQSVLAGQGDDIGQIVFALGVVVADALQQPPKMLGVDGHDAGIA